MEKVLQLKGTTGELPPGFEFGSSLELLEWVESHYGLFEFQDEEEDSLFYGTLCEVNSPDFRINAIHEDGSYEAGYMPAFQLDAIRTISFDSDYFRSILLLWKAGD